MSSYLAQPDHNTVEPIALAQRLRERLIQSMIGRSGIREAGLRRAIEQRLSQEGGQGLIRDLVFQPAWPYRSVESSLSELAGDLLAARTVEALSASPSEGFPKDRKPYSHQLEAWKTLAGRTEDGRVRSAVVSSGTGSGKTECFLVPMLDDFVRQIEREGRDPQGGVQAIMLYPLNALIESQKERLDAWTKPLRGDVRYALYNGNTPKASSARERAHKERADPQQVHDRPAIRNRPPQILVTNLTMLEYMMVRPVDAPILEKSQGKLRWIVLDEAHTYIGAQAAEVALLLRRVMNGFGVQARDVRFVATSATIGSGSATDQAKLQRFLAELAGVALDQVSVITGETVRPMLPAVQAASGPLDVSALEAADGATVYTTLATRPELRPFLDALHTDFARGRDLESAAAKFGLPADQLMRHLARAERNGQFLAPMRAHLFQRALGGLWSCVDPDCSEVASSEGPSWAHGALYLKRRKTCRCGAPVVEILSCNSCGEVALSGQIRRDGLNETLEPRQTEAERDEFLLDSLRDIEGEQDDPNETADGANDAFSQQFSHPVAFTVLGSEYVGRPCYLDNQGHVVRTPDEAAITLTEIDDPTGACPFCNARAGAHDKLFPFRFGSPSSMSDALPTLIEAMPSAVSAKDDPSDEPDKPVDGRQLLSFTDSRQGTARMAARLQKDSERAFVRSFLYDEVQASRSGSASEDERKTASDRLQKYRAMDPAMRSLLQDEIRELETLLEGSDEGLPWTKVERRLAERAEVNDWIQQTWVERGDVFQTEDGPRNIARTLLLTELLRRPRTANSAETLGIVRLRSDIIDNAQPPLSVKADVSAEDWQAFLYFLITHTLRVRNAVNVDRNLKRWVKNKLFLASYCAPEVVPSTSFQLRWPQATQTQRRNNAVQMLELGLDLDAGNPEDRDTINTLLQRAYRDLQPLFDMKPNAQLNMKPNAQLDMQRLHIAPVIDAYLCPVTRRVTDIAPFGLSPYARTNADKAVAIRMPDLPHGAPASEREAWLQSDPAVQSLRAQGVWGDIHDRSARFAKYFRTAEHSAQNNRETLKEFEDQFKAHTVNVLNCSTTMEMGVDIGSVSGVVMSNLPPAIANYQQRIGRAGRRGQSVSLGYTVAKDRPLDREAFADPIGYLKRQTLAPQVDMQSAPIVQRHVNAELLSRFMRVYDGNPINQKIGPFLGCKEKPADPGGLEMIPKAERQVTLFLKWLDRHGDDSDVIRAIDHIVRGTVCAGRTDLVEETRKAISDLRDAFHEEWKALREQHNRLGENKNARQSVINQIRRMCGDPLLGQLGVRGFLPSHGFPTHVVEFQIAKRNSEPSSSRYGNMPSRSLDIAIREFAPGSDLMVNGIVYHSGGVTLNWQLPASNKDVREVQALQTLIECPECHYHGLAHERPENCPDCGSGLVSANYSEVLRPAGFCQDRHVETHGDVETVAFVPSEDPVFAAGDAPWGQLPDPRLGQLRASREGRVLYHTRGPGRRGYGLCLHCGRMEAMREGETVCTKLTDGHRPLRYDENWDANCPGGAQPFAIRHGIYLGHEVQTDICEIRPNAPMEPVVATSVAIALREALAQRLGVEASDLGYATRRSSNVMGTDNRVIGIFDRSAGGAGYSSQLPAALGEVFNDARRLLDCKQDCERCCSNCILVHDAPQAGARALDRRAALAFMDDELAFLETLPEGFSEDTASLCPIIVDDMARRLHKGGELTLWLDLPDPAPLADWSLSPRLHAWGQQSKRVVLVIDPAVVADWSPVQRQYLRDWLMRNDVALGDAPRPDGPDGWHAFAQITDPAGETAASVYFGDASAIARPSAQWPVDTDSRTVRVDATAVEVTAIALPEVSPSGGTAAATKGMARRAHFGSDMPGRIGAFGPWSANILRDALNDLDIDPAAVTEAQYSDAYMRSPLTARLLCDCLARLCPKAELRIATRHIDAGAYAPAYVQNNFDSSQDMREFVCDYGGLVGLRVSLRTEDSVPHHRRLVLSGPNMPDVRIDFDKGFGWLRYQGPGARVFAQAHIAQATFRLPGKLSSNEPTGSQAYVYRMDQH